jgi:hypothetical protein
MVHVDGSQKRLDPRQVGIIQTIQATIRTAIATVGIYCKEAQKQTKNDDDKWGKMI